MGANDRKTFQGFQALIEYQERKKIEEITWIIVTFPSFDFLILYSRFYSFLTPSEPLFHVCLMNEWVSKWMLGFGDSAVASHISILNNIFAHVTSPKKSWGMTYNLVV